MNKRKYSDTCAQMYRDVYSSTKLHLNMHKKGTKLELNQTKILIRRLKFAGWKKQEEK